MKVRLHHFLHLSIPLLGTCTAAYSAEVNSGFDELPVVLSASRLVQPLIEAPSAVTLIDRQMIEASGARHIADLMRFVPGATVGYSDGNRPVVALHGMSGAYAAGVQVLIDGVSVYSPVWKGMQWEELPLTMNDIERIEVIRGPNAAIFGPNSVAGVINIITRHPASEKGWHLDSSMGNGGVSDYGASYSNGLDEGVAYRATVGQRSSDGFSTRPDSQRLLFGNFRSEVQLDANDAFSLSARWADNRKLTGDYTATGSSNQPHQFKSDRFDLQARWTSAVSPDDEWWIQYYHQQGHTRDKVDINYRDSAIFAAFNKLTAGLLGASLPAQIPYLVDMSYASQRDGLEFQKSQRWSKGLRSVWGLEARRDSAVSQTLFYTNAQQTSYLLRGYLNVEWQLSNEWTLHLADMIERNTLASTAWSPKATLSWQPVPGHVVRVGVSSAQRTPSLMEDKANTGFPTPSVVTNSPVFAPLIPLLQAQGMNPYRPTRGLSTGMADNEVTRTEELGYAFNVNEWGLSGDFRWAWEHHHGLLGAQLLPFGGLSPSDFRNLDRVTVEGGDFTLKWQPRQESTFRLSCSQARIRSTTNPASFNGSAPESTVSFFWDEQLSHQWRLSANYQRVGTMHWIDAGSSNINPSLSPIEYLNLRLAKRFTLERMDDAELALVIQNALGRHREYFAGQAVNGTAETIASTITFIQMSLRF